MQEIHMVRDLIMIQCITQILVIIIGDGEMPEIIHIKLLEVKKQITDDIAAAEHARKEAVKRLGQEYASAVSQMYQMLDDNQRKRFENELESLIVEYSIPSKEKEKLDLERNKAKIRQILDIPLEQ